MGTTTAKLQPTVHVGTRSTMKRQLRIATAGSVDDGKSTLIGRLLFDTKTIFEDQLDAVVRASRRYGDQRVNLALLTDGLRAEREQGITIDVAYRYFATPNRSFVLADTPGHAQYTRNMVTGASVSDVALVLVDARHGVLDQTRRHLAIAALLGVSHVVLTVNKMDLVDWDADRFTAIVADVTNVLDQLQSTATFHAVPISALLGDNIVQSSENTAWYAGPTVLELLEEIEVDDTAVRIGARLSVQWTIRAGSDYRGYAGQLFGGPLKVGDAVTVAQSGQRSVVRSITVAGLDVDHAQSGDAVAVELVDHVDVGRGDVLVASNASEWVNVGREITADLCWMTDTTAKVGARVIVKQQTSHVGAVIRSIEHRLDPATLRAESTDVLSLNDLGRVVFTLDRPIVADPYARSRRTGHFIVLDEGSNATAAAATISQLN